MTKGSRSRNGENWTRDPRAYTDRLAWDDIQLESTVAPCMECLSAGRCDDNRFQRTTTYLRDTLS